MEAVEKPSMHNTLIDNIQSNDSTSDIIVETSVIMDESHKPNGIAESSGGGDSNGSLVGINIQPAISVENEKGDILKDAETININSVNEPNVSAGSTSIESISQKNNNNSSNIDSQSTIVIASVTDHDIQNKASVIEVMQIETPNDKVTFKTEILVEKDVNDESRNTLDTAEIQDGSNVILNELGQNIELSEALCSSSDVTDHAENNNCSVRQEVFNKEELLDILEGNDGDLDTESTIIEIPIKHHDMKELEAQLALQQLSRLKRSRCNRKKRIDKLVNEDNISDTKEAGADSGITNINNATDGTEGVSHDGINKSAANADQTRKEIVLDKGKQESIVNVLVKDWEDEETLEQEKKQDKQPLSTSDGSTGSAVLVSSKVIVPKSEVSTHILLNEKSLEPENHNENLNKSEDDHQFQSNRRQSRVIKKKVIFDPDNPDTFTKSKTIGKSKQQSEKEISSKKDKVDQNAQILRSKSKSPTVKMQWKKPSSKNAAKQKNRLSEVDKLLMDEGAVNMIYQLTPEATKGKKNIRTKAEFIKKLQSSTPEGTEMKFRERKKECGRTEDEAKKISGGKHRGSISGSVKSLSACDDFENHSADDSIIYRRHSSSSYSSACMSPRRLSDLEGNIQNVSKNQLSDTCVKAEDISLSELGTVDVFMSEGENAAGSDVINKTDCLTMKEKLNSKLSLALNKRKRENSKNDKPAKKRAMKLSEDKVVKYKFLTVNCENRLAEIFIQKTGTKRNIEALKELGRALDYVNSRKDISTTLIMSECGTLCSELDLEPLLDENLEKRTNYAYEVAETVRSVLCQAESHSKMVVSGVWGACSGAALALVALSDVALAGEAATFAPPSAALPLPGLATLTTLTASRCPPHLINELYVFERCVSAREAARSGLVSRTLWPQRLLSQIRAIAVDIAAQPTQSVLLKKKLLRMKYNKDSTSTFQSCLEKERDLLVEYWTSVEGQEMLRASLDAA